MLANKRLEDQEPIRRYLVTPVDQGHIWRFPLRVGLREPDVREGYPDSNHLIRIPVLVYRLVGRMYSGYIYEFYEADV